MSTSARLCSRISRSFWHSRCIPSAQRRTSCERWRRARTRIDARTQQRATLETFQRLGATPWSGATRTQTASTTLGDPTGGPTREIRRRAATWSWRRQRPVEPTRHVRSTSRPRCELAVHYPAARPTQRYVASGAGGRIASSLHRRTADRRGHQRPSATMVARPSTPAAAGSRCHGRFRPSAAAVNSPSDRRDHGKEASETGRLPAAAGSRVRRSLSPKPERLSRSSPDAVPVRSRLQSAEDIPDVDLPRRHHTIRNRPRQCVAPCQSAAGFRRVGEKFVPRPRVGATSSSPKSRTFAGSS